MKNYIILFFLFLFLFIPKTISAVGGGVFYCQYWGTGECVVDNTFNACDSGFTSNPSSCSSLGINECDGSYFDCVSMYEEECYDCNLEDSRCYPVSPDAFGGDCPYTNKLACDTDCAALPGEANYRCYSDGCRKASDGSYSSYGACYDDCAFYEKKTKEEIKFPTCTANDGKEGIDTAIGCIPIEDSNALIGFILKWAIGVGGGIAFLLIVLAGFQIMTSAGNPDRLKAGQELMTSAIAGLILLIFSVFILRIIGVDILGLPGFGGS